MRAIRILLKTSAVLVAFVGICAFSAHWGMGPADLDDLGFDWQRGAHIQQTGCGTMTYRIYRGTEIVPDRVSFTLREEGEYTISIAFGLVSETDAEPPQVMHTSVRGFHWLPTKINVERKLPEHIWINVTREPFNARESGAWSCGGGAL
jgi:hypothetical protein